jgi:hypothetical protein
MRQMDKWEHVRNEKDYEEENKRMRKERIKKKKKKKKKKKVENSILTMKFQ